jgi:hypothetical protein
MVLRTIFGSACDIYHGRIRCIRLEAFNLGRWLVRDGGVFGRKMA